MAMKVHWFLPTNGDSRSDLSLGNAVGAAGSRVTGHSTERAPDIAYMAQIARAAEQMGFEAALMPTSSWCEDGWVMASGLAQLTERFKFLIALRPGLQSPTLSAQMAATFQRTSGNRLLLNVVTGGDDVEQQRFGDQLSKRQRYDRAGEYLHILRELWTGEPVDFVGEHYEVRDATIIAPPQWPEIYLGGSSAGAIEVAAKYADVFLTWGEPLEDVAAKIETVRKAAHDEGREVRFGIRMHVISYDTSDEAWAQADRLLAGLSPEAIEKAQAIQRASQSESQHRMTALHNGRTDALEVAPNLWAGVGLVRGGAGTALVGNHEEVADRIAEYHDIGIDEFIFSGYPHLEEAYRVGEGPLTVLRERGLLEDIAGPSRPTRVGDFERVSHV